MTDLIKLAQELDADIQFHADETVNRIAKGQGEWGARHRYVASELAKFRDKLRAALAAPASQPVTDDSETLRVYKEAEREVAALKREVADGQDFIKQEDIVVEMRRD